MQDFPKLKVWEQSHLFTLEIYRVSRLFAREEQFGLTSQIRRSSSSIPTNIAEGCGRDSSPDFARFLAIASGSACEAEYQLILARDLSDIAMDQYQVLDNAVQNIKPMIAGLKRRVDSEKTNN